MKIYIDSDFKCHTTNLDGVYKEIETDAFYGKCSTFIEGYRFVPVGESWIRSDGVVFDGEMVAPWKDWDELNAAQGASEQHLLAEYTEALRTVGVKV